MRPTLFNATHLPAFISENLGTDQDQIYHYCFESVSARQLFNVSFDFGDEISDSSIELRDGELGFAAKFNVDSINLKYRNPIAEESYVIIRCSIQTQTFELKICIFNKLSLWPYLSECPLRQNVFNNDRYLVKIFKHYFIPDLTYSFGQELVGTFETNSYNYSGIDSDEDSIGRTFQISIDVREVLQTIPKIDYFDLGNNFSAGTSRFVLPAVWSYSVESTDGTEVYTTGLMYAVAGSKYNNDLETFNSYYGFYPNEPNYSGSLRRGKNLFSNYGNGNETIISNDIACTFLFERAENTTYSFSLIDAIAGTEVAGEPFPLNLIELSEGFPLLPFYYMFFRVGLNSLELDQLDYFNKTYYLQVTNNKNIPNDSQVYFYPRKYNGNDVHFSDDKLDGYLYEDALGGLSLLPIELDFSGNVEIENQLVTFEKPIGIPYADSQRIFNIPFTFNYKHTYSGKTGYFNAALRTTIQRFLLSPFIIFRRRRILISSAEFVNMNEPSGLMYINFKFTFADNNPYYDRNYPTN